jgi:hypothetical protein
MQMRGITEPAVMAAKGPNHIGPIHTSRGDIGNGGGGEQKNKRLHILGIFTHPWAGQEKHFTKEKEENFFITVRSCILKN